MFFVTAANGYELNNLDNEALDAPVYIAISNNSNLNNQQYQDGNEQDFTSLPCEAFLTTSRTENGSNNEKDGFCHKNPMYQSAQVQLKSAYNEEDHGNIEKGNILCICQSIKQHEHQHNNIHITLCV